MEVHHESVLEVEGVVLVQVETKQHGLSLMVHQDQVLEEEVVVEEEEELDEEVMLLRGQVMAVEVVLRVLKDTGLTMKLLVA
jgi:negative regulator of genetic competence, sporulation and motility